MDLSKFYEFATATAYKAGQLTLGYYQTGTRPDWKEDDSPVTVADREAEKLIRREIEQAFPSHAILGEEFGRTQDENATHRWLIDPIDGTKSFVRGVPLYGVLMGLEIEGRIEVGVAYFPALNEMIAAASGMGAWWNGRRASVSAETDLSRAIIAHIDTASYARVSEAKGQAWQRLQNASYYNAGWCDAYAYLLVATGRVEIALDPIMNPWDCGPFPVILREAGGYFGDWKGNEDVYAYEALGTNAALKNQVIELLSEP